MSKTKEEIIRNHFEQAKLKYPNESWKDFDECKIEQEFVAEAMDTYAAQKVEEYKERLKKSITQYQLLDDTFKNAVFAIIDQA